MTTRDWAHVVLTAVMGYPVVVLVMFVYRALGVSIEPFEDAFLVTAPVLGVVILDRWWQRRAADRNADIARGAAVTMHGSVRGEGQSLPTRWRRCRITLATDSLRVQPWHRPKAPWSSFSRDSLRIVRTARHEGWRRWVMTGFRVVACRDGDHTFELSVITEDVPGLLSRLNGAHD